ncbi:MAG: tetratricopeptide repeat protein [Labilithrix sp.]|nr:tetratricopeptide repeat protein [Labilithrix sp.]
MRGRAIAGGSLLGLVALLAAGCASGARASRPEEDPSSLVIPPLGGDAATPAAPPTEPPRVRTALTIRARDPRIAARQPRSRALLMTEVKGLESLLAAAAPSSPDLPAIRRRLAESYNELAYTSSGPDAERARDRVLEHYVAIAAEHPSYPAMDEIVYYQGLAYELNGDITQARKSYLRLITEHPRSKLVPLAYFAFGELFFAEAASDPTKNDLALQAFNQVTRVAVADEPIRAEALLRTGETLLRMGRDAEAGRTFEALRGGFPESDATAKIPDGY